MAYGIKYISEFDRLGDPALSSYTIQILKKDYEGAALRVTGAASPAVHRWDTDESKPPIKGSSLEVTVVNEGSFPLSSIYSTDDEEFKIKFLWGTTVLFEGFVVQDDCSELMVDYNHEITIAANDNLGLLKDVSLDKAPASYDLLGTSVEDYAIITGGGSTAIIFSAGWGSGLAIGDKVSLDGEGPYEIRDLQQGVGVGALWNAFIVEDLPSAATVTGVVGLYRSSLLEKISLLSVVKRCLSATGLQLNTRIFSNINEITTDDNTVRFFEQTLIDPQTFFSGDKYDDCYQVLEKVLSRFNCTLFQARGTWNIVRWDETRYYNYNVPGTEYDADFIKIGNTYLDGRIAEDETVIFAGYPKFLIGIGEYSVAENGLTQRILRPFEYTKETFNYRLPDEILRNANLKQLGTLTNTWTQGSGDDFQTIREYSNVPWWFYTDQAPTSAGVNGPAEFFIRTISDNLDNEIERYLVLYNNDIHSYRIEASAGDIIRFSFRVKTHEAFTNIGIFIKLTDGTNTVYAQGPGTFPAWDTVTGDFTVSITADEWSSVDAETKTIPFDGLLTVYLRALSDDGDGANLYTDIRLEYVNLINQSTKIIGHTHTSDQSSNTKNNDEREIFVDYSPRNSIAGTLFLNELNGVIQKRCSFWKRVTFDEQKQLGEIITEENLFLRRISRTILEGTFYGVVSADEDHVSMLNVCRYTYFTDLNFIFGRLEIDYRNNNFTATLFEMYKDTEHEGELTYSYTFEFLYDSK